MSLSGVRDWICDFLHSPCTAPSRYILLKPFYNTVCFFHKAICNNGISNNIQKINLSKKNFGSKCDLTHYFTDVFGSICSSSCNITITHLQVPFKNQTNDNSCRIIEFFNIWFNETSNSVFTQVSCKPLIGEENCYIDWCGIYDYVKFWRFELYKKWCYLADCVYKQKMQIKPKTTTLLIEQGETRFEKWIRNWISQNLGIQWPRNVSFVQFVIFFCTVGGIVLFILLRVRRFTKPKTKPASLKVGDVDTNFVQMLIDVLETYKKDIESLREELDENNLKSSETIENLNKQNSDFQLQLNTLVAEYSINQKETQNKTNKLEQKCKEYENQIYILNQQLQDLQKYHSIKIEKYLTEIRKIHQLEETIDELKITHQVHQNENKFESQQQKKNEESVKQVQENLQGTSDLQTAEEVCVKQRDAKETKTTHQENSHIIESLKTIGAIFEHVKELNQQIEEFSGSEEDKTFLHLNELLIRNTLKLDNIESKGHFVIRKKRKEVLECIQNYKRILESKVLM